MKNRNQKPVLTYLTIMIIITSLNMLLARFAVIPWPNYPGVAKTYFAVAFMIVFTLWFGGWGVIATYIGCYIGAGALTGIPHGINLYWSLADVWQVLIPLIALKKLNVDVSLKTKRDFLTFLIFGWGLNNLIGAGWGAVTLAIGGIALWNDVPNIFTGWLLSNLIVTIAITPLMLRHLTPYIRQAGLYVKRYWL